MAADPSSRLATAPAVRSADAQLQAPAAVVATHKFSRGNGAMAFSATPDSPSANSPRGNSPKSRNGVAVVRHLRDPPPEPADIQKLRAELKAKEDLLELLRRDTGDHPSLVEALERGTLQSQLQQQHQPQQQHKPRQQQQPPQPQQLHEEIQAAQAKPRRTSTPPPSAKNTQQQPQQAPAWAWHREEAAGAKVSLKHALAGPAPALDGGGADGAPALQPAAKASI